MNLKSEERQSKKLENQDAFDSLSAKANWYFGQWHNLAEIDLHKFERHPDIHIFAALKAFGFQQLGDMARCKKYIRIAQEKGCDQQTISKLLIKGIHNSLGNIAILKKDDQNAKKHFEASLEFKIFGRSQDQKLAMSVRSMSKYRTLDPLTEAQTLDVRESAYTKSVKNRLSIYRAMVCPLCECEKYFVIKTYQISKLQDIWNNDFGIEAFSKELLGAELKRLRCTKCNTVFYSPTIVGDEELYKKLEKFEWYYEEDKWEYDVTLDIIADLKPQKLLEVGCGRGYFLEKVDFAIDAQGIELNTNAVTICREKKLEVTKESIKDIDSKFDMIVSFQVLEHLPGIRNLLQEMVDRLNKNGVLIISVPNPQCFLSFQGVPVLDLPPHHCMGFNEKSFEFISKDYNLNLVKYIKEPLRYVHFKCYMDINYTNKIENQNLNAVPQLLGPYLYEQVSKSIIGHTHIAVFQKR